MALYRVMQVKDVPEEWNDFVDSTNAQPHVKQGYLSHLEIIHRRVEKALGKRKPLHLLDEAKKDAPLRMKKEALKVRVELDKLDSDYTLGDLARRYLKFQGREDLMPLFKFKRPKNGVTPDMLLTEDDVNRMIGAAENQRDAALVALLWEAGQRIGAVLSLDLKDLTVEGEFLKAFFRVVKVEGEEHPSLLIESTKHLRPWLDAYPFPRTRDTPIFVSFAPGFIGERLTEDGARQIFQKLADKARVKVHVHPHVFRHSRATFLLRQPEMNEATVKKLLGWCPNSKMLGRYNHLADRDAEDAYLRLHQLKPRERVKGEGLCPPKEGLPAFPANSKAAQMILGQVQLAGRIAEIERILKKAPPEFAEFTITGSGAIDTPTAQVRVHELNATKAREHGTKLVQVGLTPELHDALRALVEETVAARESKKTESGDASFDREKKLTDLDQGK